MDGAGTPTLFSVPNVSADSAEKKVGLLIRGKVQGVFYRESARQQAAALGLRGYVKNLPSGEVEAEVHGPSGSVETFMAWCRRGPAGARVDAVEERASSGRTFQDFKVER